MIQFGSWNEGAYTVVATMGKLLSGVMRNATTIVHWISVDAIKELRNKKMNETSCFYNDYRWMLDLPDCGMKDKSDVIMGAPIYSIADACELCSCVPETTFHDWSQLR